MVDYQGRGPKGFHFRNGLVVRDIGGQHYISIFTTCFYVT